MSPRPVGRPKGFRVSESTKALISQGRQDRELNKIRPIAPSHHGTEVPYEVRRAVTLRDEEKCVPCGDRLLLGKKWPGTNKQMFHDEEKKVPVVYLSRAGIRVRPLYGDQSDPENPDHWVLICRWCWKNRVVPEGMEEALKGIRVIPEI